MCSTQLAQKLIVSNPILVYVSDLPKSYRNCFDDISMTLRSRVLTVLNNILLCFKKPNGQQAIRIFSFLFIYLFNLCFLKQNIVFSLYSLYFLFLFFLYFILFFFIRINRIVHKHYFCNEVWIRSDSRKKN